MNCPHCEHQDHLEIDLHSDGFSADLLECSECGALLAIRGRMLETVHGPVGYASTMLSHAVHA